VCPRSRPLLLSAVLIGAGSSVWWTFSVDALRMAGMPESPARTAYALCGVAGIIASGTGALAARAGLRRSYFLTCAVLAASLGMLGLTGASFTAAVVAALLFGVSYNGVFAVQGLWSADVFGDRPSAGLAAVNTALTAGTITGPAVAGMVIHSHGYGIVLGASAAVVALAAVQAPPSRPHVHDAHAV